MSNNMPNPITSYIERRKGEFDKEFMVEGGYIDHERYDDIKNFHQESLTNLLSLIAEEVEKMKVEHGAYWDSNEKDLKCNSEHEMCEITAYNKALTDLVALLQPKE